MEVEGNIRNRPPGDQDQELSDTKRTMINKNQHKDGEFHQRTEIFHPGTRKYSN